MSSSLRNSLHRRNHKERSQLAHRTRLGLLEKHKDYVKRARDFHSKQDRIKRLKEKAAERNKDEFYFGMTKSQTKEGVHITDRGNTSLPIDFVKILKTQDENYVRAVRQANRKKIDKIKTELATWADLTHPGHLDDDMEDDSDNEEERKILREAGLLATSFKKRKHKPKHVVFVSDKAEAVKYKAPQSIATSSKTSIPLSPDAEAEEEESIELGWRSSKTSSTQKKQLLARTEESEEIEKDSSDIEETGDGETGDIARDRRSRLLRELAARLRRDRNLRYAARELEMQRLLMGKGASRKIRGATLVEGDARKKDEDEDERDARRGRRRKPEVGMEPQVYLPKVYKWKAERKR